MQRSAGPLVAYALRQLFENAFNHAHGHARTHTRCGAANELIGWRAVVAQQLGRAIGPVRGGEGAEGHHLTLAVAHRPFGNVLGQHAMRRIRLNVDALDAGVVQKVIHIGAAHGTGERAIDVGIGQAQGRGFSVINVQAQLGRVIQIGGAHRRQLRSLARLFGHKVAGRQQGLMAHAVHVFQHEVKARIRPQTTHGGRVHDKHLGVTDAA